MQTKLIKVGEEIKEMNFEEVLEQFKGMVHSEYYSQKSRINRWEEEKDDMIQNGYIWLWNAYSSYDISKGNQFSTYAYMYIKRGVQDITLKNNSQKRSNLNTTSFNASLSNDDEEFSLENLLSYEDYSDNNIILTEAIAYSTKSMTEKEKEMLTHMINETSTKEIASILGVTPVLVSQRKNIVKKKLIKGFEDYGYNF